MIRKYESGDRQAVRRICCETALMGEPSSVFFDDDEIFADALTEYFTDYEPESCFVAECDNNVVGYLVGSKDVRRMNKLFTGMIASHLLIKAMRRGVFFRAKNIRFISSVLLSLVRGEFRAPDLSGDYPATLHINIMKEYRMSGLGSRLIAAYLDYLRSQSVMGVHFATMSEKAGQFFRKQNFQLLFRGRRSCYRYLLGRDIPIYIYGMRS